MHMPASRMLGGFVAATLVLAAGLGAALARDAPRGSEQRRAGAASVDLVFDAHAHAVFEVQGLPAPLVAVLAEQASPGHWQRFFTVHSIGADGTPTPRTMLGAYRVAGGRLRFLPRFPPVPGLAYRVRVDVAGLARLADVDPTGRGSLERTVVVPPVDAPLASLEQIFPSGSSVPANLLKIYLHFSASMSRGEAYRRVTLRDANGSLIAAPFLEIDEELWDPEQRRLTLFFDPGRIKRGLRPHDESGPPLVAGRRYRLAIDGGWPDAHGRPLRAGVEKTLVVRAADRKPPQLGEWRLTPPRAGSKTPLEVVFDEPMEHALALRMVRVERADGSEVSGQVRVVDGERRWHLRPAAPWAPGRYRLSVDGAFEDLAGNSLRGAFDRDLRHGAQEAEQGRYERDFEVLAGPSSGS